MYLFESHQKILIQVTLAFNSTHLNEVMQIITQNIYCFQFTYTY